MEEVGVGSCLRKWPCRTEKGPLPSTAREVGGLTQSSSYWSGCLCVGETMGTENE